MERCAECGYDYSEISRNDLPDALRTLGPGCQSSLEVQETSRLRARLRPDVWSPLEYACHVRDLLTVQKERIQLALV